ncbi:hypothetical protein ACIPIN_06140 [Pseudomonas sp. NPDC087697]|uniref:hypothetical protein n=1 Tax=Pseudomonas sp. NPDC087697 TaxID=3364447 RepID=UPI00381411A9
MSNAQELLMAHFDTFVVDHEKWKSIISLHTAGSNPSPECRPALEPHANGTQNIQRAIAFFILSLFPPG